MVAHRPGSFETLYDIAYPAAVFGGGILTGALKDVGQTLLTDLIKSVYGRVTGTERVEDIPDTVAELDRERGGDINALVEAAEPSVRLGHTVINHGVINININQAAEVEQSSLALLNPETKKFVWDKIINNEMRAKLFSIGSFNANQGTGRAFDLELGKSIPFEILKDADAQTINTILQSISDYTRKRRLGDNLRSAVALKYTSVDAVDGRLKKIRIHKARPDFDDL
ncbi:MAG: hypothetical protein ABJH33_01225 [Rhizobiaceae bacterium]